MPGGLENTSGGETLFDSSDQPVRKGKFPNLLSAVAQIQRYAMIEREGGEIPVDFLTIEGQLNFFNVGLGSGFVHGLFFLLSQMISYAPMYRNTSSLRKTNHFSFLSIFPLFCIQL